MSISSRIRHHIRSNVVAYLALFAALGGTAIALPGKNKVDSNDIAKQAVKSRALANGAVKARALRDGAVKNAKLATGAVTGTKLADGTVVQTKLGDAAVASPKLAEDSVIRPKIAQGAVNGGKLANGAVDSAKVNNGSLLGEDFAAGQLSDGFLFEAPTGDFTIARAGRIFVTATLEPTCPTPPCVYTVEVDDVAVPGAAFTTDSEPAQITLAGLTAALAAGPHTVSLVSTGAGSEATQVRLGGILLQ